MAYATQWHPGAQAEQSIAEAIRRAGASALGYLFRFTDQKYASSDPWGDDDSWTTHTCIELEAFPIYKLTPCGWTLEKWNGARRRWVSKETTKQFALPTVEEALVSYVKRKQKQEAIYQARANAARINMQTALGKWRAFS